MIWIQNQRLEKIFNNIIKTSGDRGQIQQLHRNSPIPSVQAPKPTTSTGLVESRQKECCSESRCRYSATPSSSTRLSWRGRVYGDAYKGKLAQIAEVNKNGAQSASNPNRKPKKNRNEINREKHSFSRRDSLSSIPQEVEKEEGGT